MHGKKKKLKFGDYLKQNSAALGSGMGFAGQALDSLLPDTSIGGGIATGALKGASSLAALGPIGMGIGAVGGAALGWLGADKAKNAAEQAQGAAKLASDRNLMGNAGNAFKAGGKMKGKFNVLQGGSLNQISPDAVEVDANNPGATDSVELEEAFVDHNEVIDRENRVFSDSVFLPNGKSIAQEAKKLEKMKGTSKRFDKANKLVDSKVDALFDYQERSKKQAMKKGGKMKPKFELGTPSLYGDDEDELRAAYGTSAPSLEDASPWLGTNGASTGKSGLVSKGNNPNSFNFNPEQALTGLATVGPNIVNSFLQKRLKGPAGPVMETSTRLKRINPNAQLTEAAGDYNQAVTAVTRGTAQGSALGSNIGSLLSKKLGANNQMFGQNNQLNAQIQNQESFLNQGVKARNVGRLNEFNQGMADLDNKKLQMSSENTANLSGKILMQGREKNQMKKDMFALDVIKSQYGDSGIFQRELGKLIDARLEAAKSGKKMGGKLTKKRKK